MLLIKAVDYRILELCKAYNLSINGLANKAGMPPSTVASLLSEKSRNPTEDTIFKICIGFGMRMDKFYASNLFDIKNISLSEDDILDIGQKIAGLQKYNLGSVNRQDTAEIAAE